MFNTNIPKGDILSLVQWLIMLLLLFLVPVSATRVEGQAEDCAASFDDARAYTAEFYDRSLADIEGGVIVWDSTDWEGLVLRVVASAEHYLNNCIDPALSLADQPEALAELAALSQILPPVAAVEVGGDFGEAPLAAAFTPFTDLVDLNVDGADELLLHTQVPYFSADTVYSIRGGLSIAFFQTSDGWQGHVIAPVTEFVTTQEGPHQTYAMIEPNMLSVDSPDQALRALPGPQVQVVVAEDGTPLTYVTLLNPTPLGEAKELSVMTWDESTPSVVLRVAFDEWCTPGQALSWTIGGDGSVVIPSNGVEEGSALHCGRTPEAIYEWSDGAFVLAE